MAFGHFRAVQSLNQEVEGIRKSLGTDLEGQNTVSFSHTSRFWQQFREAAGRASGWTERSWNSRPPGNQRMWPYAGVGWPTQRSSGDDLVFSWSLARFTRSLDIHVLGKCSGISSAKTKDVWPEQRGCVCGGIM